MFFCFFCFVVYLLLFMANVNSKGQTHDQLQAACYKEACRRYHPFLIRALLSVPNDMAGNNAPRARHYQAIGVTAGVWDMLLNWFEIWKDPTGSEVNKLFPATHWFEFKVGSDKLSDNQKKFMRKMLPLKHKFYVISEEEQFYDHLELIIKPTLYIAKHIWPIDEKEEQRTEVN